MYKNSKKLLMVLAIILAFCNMANANVVITLQGSSAGKSFTGLLNEASGTPDVGVVLMHGRTSQPDGAVVRQLRNALFSAGYTTLSIDNPHANSYLSNAREFADYVNDTQNSNYAFPEAYARVNAAVTYLQNLGVNKVVLIGFSMGSRFMAAYLARAGKVVTVEIKGFVGVGMYANNVDPLNHAMTLDETTVSIYDVYGDDDIDAVNTALSRKNAYLGNSNNSNSNYETSVFNCEAGLITTDCHKLVRLKSANGELCRELENGVIDWILRRAPLTNPQGRGVCETGLQSASNNSEGGGMLYFLLILSLIQIRVRKVFQLKV